jgi:TM2 domain-containing membrane protein YozV
MNEQPPIDSTQQAAPISPAAVPYVRRVNKILYILMAFFFGAIGVHRFLRGQVGWGVIMILASWLTFYIWPLVDFIISLVKLGEYPGEDYFFTRDGKWTH